MTTVNERVTVIANERIAADTCALRFRSPLLARALRPGQFLNVLVTERYDPLLRRPFSISMVDGDLCELLYVVVGKGTAMLAELYAGDEIGVLGPLGNSFGVEKPFETALIVAGGIGVAPFPYLTAALRERGRRIETFLGARSADRVVRRGLDNLHVATDDGSEGRHGTVVECLEDFLAAAPPASPMIFSCGPMPMLRAVQDAARRHGIPCELSLESEMACGMGICQGCPVQRAEGERRYALVCTDGPCFDAGDIVLHIH
jgi:dihydroorotate dehydrogenase electron transfer subunit